MKCHRCHFENQEGMKYCGNCGSALVVSSELFSKELSPEEKIERMQRYLPKDLTEKILAQKEKIEGERKQVTIMFCDMKEFTPLAEELGPERTFILMDKVLELLIHKVYRYGGTVNEIRGDGILALFGAPIALEGAPRCAVQASIAIHREIREFNKRLDEKIPPILLRIGLNTGTVVVGALGNDLQVQFAVVGDTINMAARMEELAEPGTTYVTEKTYRLTRTLFQYDALGERAVKGKEKPVRVYRILSDEEEVYRPRLGSERMIYSEMVGRDRELDRLELLLMKTVNGAGSIINIIGEAGLGKSRLVSELKRREVARRATFLEGRAISIGRNLSFHPIIDLFKQWAHIRKDDGEATSLGKLETAVRDICEEDMYEVFPFIATLMGMKLSGQYGERTKGIEGDALEKLILKNIRELFIRASELNPLVIVLEDLHWADTSSIKVMESMFRLVEKQRILFLNVFRPGYTETGDRIIKTIKERLPAYYVEICLEPLDEKMSETLIDNMLQIRGLHHPIIRQIVGRAGGNPFFMEEVVRSFIDEGAVVRREDTFEVTEKMGTIAIPNTINDVLMSRIDRLNEKTRNLIKIASVIGRSFFYRILADVAGAIDDVEGRLSQLKEMQLIQERKRMDELEYFFKHALVQEVAYDSILSQKRKELHLHVAVSIEKVFGHRLVEFYGMLAYHYCQAENLEKAEEYLIKAGEEALRSSASSEALNYYEEALTLYKRQCVDAEDPEKIAMFHRNIATALYNKGRYEEAVEYFDRALEFYWGSVPRHHVSEMLVFLSGMFHLLVTIFLPALKLRKTPTKKDEVSLDLFLKKIAALSIIDPKRFIMASIGFARKVTAYDLKKFQSWLGSFVGYSTIFSFSGISFKLSRRILDFSAARIDRDHIKTYTIFDFSETLHKYLEGDWGNMHGYSEDLIEKNLSIGEVYWASQHFFWNCLPHIYRGNFDTARLIINRLSDLYEVYENEVSLLFRQLLLTVLFMECRKTQDAMGEIEKGIDFAQKTHQGLSLLHMHACKCSVLMFKGKMKEAEHSLELADEMRKEVNTAPWQVSNFFKTRMMLDLNRLEQSVNNNSDSSVYRIQAEKSGRMFLKLSKKVAQNRTESYRFMGIYFWLINKRERALALWKKAVHEGERLGARLELSRTYSEIGKRLLEPESRHKELDGIKAEKYLEMAKALFEEMDLQWDFRELKQVFNDR
jgi:class 3 adenylate cyclase/tetratricopeptide (TPR) repeat protein